MFNSLDSKEINCQSKVSKENKLSKDSNEEFLSLKESFDYGNPFEDKKLYNLTDFKNLDIFNLENNIVDMCDNPSFLYGENNYSFLDNQVDNIIDNMFMKNNIVVKNKVNEDCNVCQVNKKEKDLKKQNSSENLEIKLNFNNLKNEGDKMKEKLEVKENADDKNKGIDKKSMLNSLISQLDDLENLVKNTKKELMNFNNKKDLNDIDKEEFINLDNKIKQIFK